MKWKLRAIGTLGVGVALCGASGALGAQGLLLVEDGKSDYVIYHEPSAPQTVKLAATELQRVVRLSTGVELPIKERPSSPMVALGENPAAHAAGLSAQSLPDDAFRIATKEKDLFILGKDTPDDFPWPSWASRGTLYGTFEFLERVVGVRWLMPGEWGEDIPTHSNLEVPVMSLTVEPDFAMRDLVCIQERRARMWMLHQKMTPPIAGRKLSTGHSWDDYIPNAVLEAHPEYLAWYTSGRRSRLGRGVKYCTTHPELVPLFAEGVIRWLEAHPTLRSASISPSDGGDFCECDRCTAWVTKDPHGRPSRTLAILDFYNRVARIVGKKHPDRPLGALVYYNYMYPPEQPVAIEPNLYLCWAPLNYYGWGLAKPVYQAEFPHVMARWTALTRRFVYHNYSTWMRSLNGAPVPPGLELLKRELPTAKRCGVWGAFMVGMEAWGYGAVGNYLLAKQMWDADVDVEALYREWLQRAYGPGWPAMDRLYRLLEARFLDRKRKESPQYRGEMYEINRAFIEAIHLPLFPEMERLYFEALAKAATEPQRKRLQMFADNLILLHYNMRHAGMLADPKSSRFYCSDEEFPRFLEESARTFALAADDTGKPRTSPIWEGEWSGQ